MIDVQRAIITDITLKKFWNKVNTDGWHSVGWFADSVLCETYCWIDGVKVLLDPKDFSVSVEI